MRAIISIFSFVLLLWGARCTNKFAIYPQNGYYYIHVFDDSDEEDLSLEAKALLYSYIKKEYHIKGNFSIQMSHFQLQKSFQCKNGLHQIFLVPISSLQIVQPPLPKESYKDLRKEIFYQIALIETKDELTLKDLYTLYNLYFALGKIRKANEIMDKILQREFKGEQ